MEGNKFPHTKWIVGGLVLIVLAFWAGIHVGFSDSRAISTIAVFADDEALPPEDVDFTPLWKAWHILDNRFVAATTTNPLTDEEKIWGLIQGLTNAYGDPYTVFLPPAESEIFEEDIRGEFGGVGIEIGVREGALTVIAPLKDTPADKAGLKAGDRIVGIDGESTQGITVDEAVLKIRGEVGSPVVLTVVSEGSSETRDVTIVRAIIEIPTIETELRGDGVFVIRLFNFTATSPNLFRQALREFVQSGSDKLVLDLRNNPGGFLEASVDIASWFLPAGKVVVTEEAGERSEDKVHRSKGYNIFTDKLKMAVLINKGSASASEIVAGALRDHGKATLVGVNTFGKGSVQELIGITSATSLKVTIARWVTPNGESISDGGLEPDVIVEVKSEDVDGGRDLQLERAVELLLNGNN